MARRAWRAMCLVGVVGLLVSVPPRPGAEEPTVKSEKSGLAIELQLPDGHDWVLDKGGLGRPFLARLVLVNWGPESIRVWTPEVGEGRLCPSVSLTNRLSGHLVVLRPRLSPVPDGIASFSTIKPGEVKSIELELLRLIGECSPPEGIYMTTAHYISTIDRSGTLVKGVWTGSIKSGVEEVRIVAPGRK